MIDLLVRLVDTRSNAGFVDQALGAVIDFSSVTWIIQAPVNAPREDIGFSAYFRGRCEPEVGELPRSLADRLTQVDLQYVGPEHYSCLIIDVLAEVLEDRGIPLPPELGLDNLLDTASSWRHPTMAEIYANLDELVRSYADNIFD